MQLGIGEVAALVAALVWASSTLLYKRFSHSLSPLELNVNKGMLAAIMMLLAIIVTQDLHAPSAIQSWYWLIASGVIGIAIGDSAYFAALRNIGPARTLIIESFAPAIAGILNIIMLGSYLLWQAWLGIVITIVGVLIALKPKQLLPELERTIYVKGILFALLAAFCQAAGMVMSKGAMNAEQSSSLWAALIRLLSGTFSVAVLVFLLKEHSLIKAVSFHKIEGRGWLLSAIFFGTFIGLWLQLISVKYTDPAIAQTIFATAPLMVMTIGFVRKEPVTANMVLGGLLALLGVGVLLLS
ncbi:EamA family transporter [Pseudoalteromonas sp. JBTF-M23]|uniref:EamA family transporter n=1 Tax=Pseudoalteromonas caenipelagi TaxID=2726988 RepID=A0A849V8V3_9GAMM|nr:DMT family transporter [Pseudoalteromonas caenipelagi]NOU49315.1 EamA family transporter [Pseudoalteromonas caenipelagi]